MRVSINADGNRPVDTAQVHLEFDPAKLQVESISSGARLEYPLLSNWDNGLGTVKYAAGTLDSPAESPFTLCTVRFRVTTQIGSKNKKIGFADRSNTLRTKVIRQGLNITGQLFPLEINSP